MSFYTWVRSRCPLTHRGFQKRISATEQWIDKRFKLLEKSQNKTAKELIQQIAKVQNKNVENSNIIQQLYKAIEVLKMQNSQLVDKLNKLDTVGIESKRAASESVWGEIFNQTIQGSNWLKDTSFSPGRWAIGYQYLYALYRILNEVQPKYILELGLGQSTKMISQYAEAFPAVSHQVVEHDPEWISFFARNYKLPKNTKLICLEREFVPYKDSEKVRVFKGFKEQFNGQKFDFISIDAPLGGDMKQYARIDVLQCIPGILAEDFIIMIDDCNRSGEQQTVKEMENKLREYQIEYVKGCYSGNKDCIVLASKKMKFVCTM